MDQEIKPNFEENQFKIRLTKNRSLSRPLSPRQSINNKQNLICSSFDGNKKSKVNLILKDIPKLEKDHKSSETLINKECGNKYKKINEPSFHTLESHSKTKIFNTKKKQGGIVMQKTDMFKTLNNSKKIENFNKDLPPNIVDRIKKKLADLNHSISKNTLSSQICNSKDKDVPIVNNKQFILNFDNSNITRSPSISGLEPTLSKCSTTTENSTSKKTYIDLLKTSQFFSYKNFQTKNLKQKIKTFDNSNSNVSYNKFFKNNKSQIGKENENASETNFKKYFTPLDKSAKNEFNISKINSQINKKLNDSISKKIMANYNTYQKKSKNWPKKKSKSGSLISEESIFNDIVKNKNCIICYNF